MRPSLLAPHRPVRATILILSFILVGVGARASDAPPAHPAEKADKVEKTEKAEKKDGPPAVVVAPPPSPATQDPMDKLRQRLAAKLGVAPSGAVARSDVISVALKAPASTGHDAEPRSAPAGASAKSHKVVGKETPGHDAHWGYDGSAGPDAWSTLKPEFAKCSSGTRQSPIDIQGGIRVDLEPVQFDYKPSAFRVLDNGHTVQVNVAPGNSIEVNGRRFELVQFHFHRPSEERIDGKQFDMVVHLVHKDMDGRLAVVAVLLERGAAHAVVQSVWNNLPLEKGEELAARATMNIADLLPADRSYFTYMGSLTTPPCSEGVLWMVMKTPMPISAAQIGIFAHLYPMNARPVQASAGRLIKQSN
jgi:carbonic anhydrase